MLTKCITFAVKAATKTDKLHKMAKAIDRAEKLRKAGSTMLKVGNTMMVLDDASKSIKHLEEERKAKKKKKQFEEREENYDN